MKINQIISILVLLGMQPYLIGMVQAPRKPEKVVISPQVKKELIQLLQGELQKKSVDVSTKSDYKLQQYATGIGALRANRNELAYLAQILKIDDARLKILLNTILQRVEIALKKSAQRAGQLAGVPQPEQIKVKPEEKTAVPLVAPVVEKTPQISLLKAAETGDLAAVEWHLAHGTPVNSSSPGDETPLAIAAERGHVAIVTRLIKAGADVNARNINGHTALTFALFQKHFPVVKELIAAGVDVNAADQYGDTPLMKAALKGHEDIVKALLAAEADIDAVNKHGDTARSLAAIRGYHNIKKLLDDAPRREYTRADTIWDAVLYGDVTAIVRHIKSGANINAQNDKGETPLILAAARDDGEIVALLLKAKARLNEKDKKGITALMRALQEKHVLVAGMLMRAGADITIKNAEGKSALTIAIARGLEDVTKELISLGADVNEKDKDDFTVLMLASYLHYRNVNIIPMLVAAGADVNAKDDDDVTALMVAASRVGSTRAIKQLLAAGADVDNEDVTGKTALDYARATKNDEAIELLIGAHKKAKATARLKAPSVPEVVSELKPPAAQPAPTTIAKPPVPQAAAPVSKPAQAKKPAAPALKPPAAKPAPAPVAKKPASKAATPVAADLSEVGNALLHKAVKKGKIDVVRKLLKDGAVVNAQNNKGETGLLIASRCGNVGMVQLLLKAGANPNIAEHTGITPLQSAVMSGHIAIAQLLLDAGAEINAREMGHRRTPLHWVVRMTVGSVQKLARQIPVERSVELLNLLLGRGADRSARDDENKTPLAWARIYELWPLANVLEKAAAAH